MNFPGTTLDILNTFSHQQLKTIEAALSSTFAAAATNNGSTCGNSAAAASAHHQQPFNFLLVDDHHNHNSTPPTWAESDHDFIFDEIETAMNNLPKIQNPASAGTTAGGVPLPNQQLAEYLAMQQQAQQLHQQQTQQQNQALLGQPAQVFLNSRPFNTIESQHASVVHQQASGGAGIKLSTGSGAPQPPVAIPQLTGPASMTITQVMSVPSPLTQPGPPPLAQQQPHMAQQQQKQQQPLALTSNVGRSPPPLLIKTPATSLMQQAADHLTVTASSSTIGQPPNDATGGQGPPQLHTTTVKLSYQQKDGAAGNSTPTAAPPPLLLHNKPPGPANTVLPAPTSTVPPSIVPIERPPGAIPTVPQQQLATNPNLKADHAGATATEKRNEVTVKPVGPPGQVPVTPPPQSANNNNNKASSAASKPAIVPATVTTPSKTSMKLATVTTPRIKQTARKNQSALQQQRSPTNLASISPVKATASPVKTPPVTAAVVVSPSTNNAAPPQKGPSKVTQGGGVTKSVPLALEKAVAVAAIAAPTTAAAVVNSPVVVEKTPKKAREPKVKSTGGEEVVAASSSGASGGGKAKRNRIKTVPYQTPTPEMTLAQKLSIAASESPVSSKKVTNGGDRAAVAGGSRQRSSVDSGGEDKLTLFYKNEFVAVRNAEDGFFLCQVLQNVFKSSPKIRIRWLSETSKAGTYTPDFYDVTDLECILTNVELEKEKGEYQLPKEEQTRIENILKKAMGLLAVSEITEDNPDGLDLSIYKDEAQLERKETTSGGRKSSNKRGEASSGSISSSSSEGAPLKSAKKPTPPAALSGTKRTSNGVAKAGKSSPIASSSKETPTRVSKRARAIQSPNYREDDDDDLPLAARTTVPATPKVAKIAPRVSATTKPVTPATHVAKKKPTTTATATIVAAEAKKETLVVAAVIPTPVVAPTPPVAVKKPAGKTIPASVGVAVLKTGPKPKGKEMKMEPPKVSPVPAKEKKTPGKRKAEPVEVKVPEKKSIVAEVVSPPAPQPPPAKKAKASPGATGKKAAAATAKPSFDEDESLASLAKTVQAESTTKKADGKVGPAAVSGGSAAKGTGKKQANEASANPVKGRAGRGKK